MPTAGRHPGRARLAVDSYGTLEVEPCLTPVAHVEGRHAVPRRHEGEKDRITAPFRNRKGALAEPPTLLKLASVFVLARDAHERNAQRVELARSLGQCNRLLHRSQGL